MEIRSTLVIFSALLTSSMIITSCGTDPAIQQAQGFGATATDFQTKTDALADDIYNSCIRKISYYSVREGTEARDQALNLCETQYKPAADNAKKANSVVTNYITSIGNLASDNPITFDNEFNSIKTALNNFSIPIAKDGTIVGSVTLPTGIVTVGTQIANVVFGWVVNVNRKGSLTEAIVCTDQPLRTYLIGTKDDPHGLEFAFREGYINGVLKDEEDTAQSYYNFYITRLRKDGTEGDFMKLEKESSEARQNFVTRSNMAEFYIAIIQATAKAHTKLKVVFLGDSTTPSKESCNLYLKAKESNPAAINPDHPTNSPNRPLTLKQLAQVREIVLNYRQEIEPLLKKMGQGSNDQK